MILTVTLNPALDISGVVPELIPNEKAYVTQEVRMPGGNGINAGRIAHRLGSQVLATGFMGGMSGAELKGMLDQEKLKHQFVSIAGSTRTNITISLEEGYEQTRLSFPGPRIRKSEMDSLAESVRRRSPKLLVIGGSSPAGVSVQYLKKLVKESKQKNVPVFVDVPGALLKDVIKSAPLFIKPNLTEFQEMTGTRSKKIKDVIQAARTFSSLIPLQCISSVEGGALLVTKEQAWFGKTPEIKVQSTVGAGDSMVGAMAHAFVTSGGILNERNLEMMLRLGLAASCATLTNKGLSMGSRKSILSYVPKIHIRRIE